MTRNRVVPEPPRLAADHDCVGELLRRSEEAFRGALAEGPAWSRFQRRTQRKQWILWLVPALSCALAAGLYLPHRAPTSDPNALSVTPEPVRPRPSASAPNPPAAQLERRIPSFPSPGPSARIPKPSARLGLDGVDDATCRRRSSEGKLEQAVLCFQALSQGTDLRAEVALYQAARLSRDGLHDARRALAFLDQHRQRFPGSALRGEVEWLRVQSLKEVGKLDEALSASEALLATPSGRALASKLHSLRGHIYAQARGDCAHAVREFVALLGELGPDGDDAELGRAQCLETLARPSEARAAYERYLARGDARQVGLAQQRLLALTPTPAPALAPVPEAQP